MGMLEESKFDASVMRDRQDVHRSVDRIDPTAESPQLADTADERQRLVDGLAQLAVRATREAHQQAVEADETEVVRCRDDQSAPRPRYPNEFGQAPVGIRDVFERVQADDKVE